MSEQAHSRGKPHSNAISLAGLVIALAAFVGASCCTLPLVLASLGFAGAWIANLEVFVVYRAYIAVAALIVIMIGWGVAFDVTHHPGHMWFSLWPPWLLSRPSSSATTRARSPGILFQ